MARKDEALSLAQQGLLPSEISTRMTLSPESVIQHLRTKVGEGAVRFSDIYFYWPADKRAALEILADGLKADQRAGFRAIHEAGACLEDVEFYRSLRQRRRFAGDLYEHVAEAELAVHDMVHTVLVD